MRLRGSSSDAATGVMPAGEPFAGPAGCWLLTTCGVEVSPRRRRSAVLAAGGTKTPSEGGVEAATLPDVHASDSDLTMRASIAATFALAGGSCGTAPCVVRRRSSLSAGETKLRSGEAGAASTELADLER